MGAGQNHHLVSHIYYERWAVCWRLDLKKFIWGSMDCPGIIRRLARRSGGGKKGLNRMQNND